MKLLFSALFDLIFGKGIDLLGAKIRLTPTARRLSCSPRGESESPNHSEQQ
jgi:hypothetical protein